MSEFIVGLLNKPTVNKPDSQVSYVFAQVFPVVGVWRDAWIEERDCVLYVCVNEAEVEQDVPKDD